MQDTEHEARQASAVAHDEAPAHTTRGNASTPSVEAEPRHRLSSTDLSVDDLLGAAEDAEARLEAVLAAVDAAQAALIEVRRGASQALVHARARRDPRATWPTPSHVPSYAVHPDADEHLTVERRRGALPRVVEMDIDLAEPSRRDRLGAATGAVLRYGALLVAALFVLLLIGALVYGLFVLTPDDLDALFDPISH